MALEIEVMRPSGPGDAAGLDAFIARTGAARIRHMAVLGKVEGPATLNDFSRELAQNAAEAAITAAGGATLLARSWRIFSTGCEGIASPLTIAIAATDTPSDASDDSQRPGLVLGAARSAPLAANERCGRGHIMLAADATRDAMRLAGLSAEQVALVLIKSPVLSPNEAATAPGTLRRHAGSTGASRGAAALGAGLALGDIDPADLDDDPVGRTTAFATRTMSFSGTEADRIEVVVLGVRPGGDARWRIATHQLSDLLDWPTASIDPRPSLAFFKAGIPASGQLRGRRTTVLTSDLTADKQLRAAASGIIGARIPKADTFITAGAEHQGPPGACLLAVIAPA